MGRQGVDRWSRVGVGTGETLGWKKNGKKETMGVKLLWNYSTYLGREGTLKGRNEGKIGRRLEGEKGRYGWSTDMRKT